MENPIFQWDDLGGRKPHYFRISTPLNLQNPTGPHGWLPVVAWRDSWWSWWPWSGKETVWVKWSLKKKEMKSTLCLRNSTSKWLCKTFQVHFWMGIQPFLSHTSFKYLKKLWRYNCCKPNAIFNKARRVPRASCTLHWPQLFQLHLGQSKMWRASWAHKSKGSLHIYKRNWSIAK